MNFYNKNTNEEETIEEEEEVIVKNVYNNVYYYGPVNRSSVCKLSQLLKTLENDLIKLKSNYSLPKTPKIFLYIHSEGGDVFAGLSAMDAIKKCKIPVVTIADGCVASAASFMLLGGSEKRITENSQILIHEIKTEFWGRYTELKDEMINCEKLMNLIKKLYRDNTSIPPKQLNSLLKKDLFLNAEECKSYGLVDNIQ